MGRHTPRTVMMIDRCAELQIRLTRYFSEVGGEITPQEKEHLAELTALKVGLMQLDEARLDVISILDTGTADLPNRERRKKSLQRHIYWEWQSLNDTASAPALVPTG